MAYITGADTKIGLKIAGTFGTATQAGASDGMEVESLEQSTNPERLEAAPIGSGLIMQNETRQGATDPRISLSKIAGYNDAGNVGLALFHGRDNVATLGSGAYIHSLINTDTFNASWVTLAFQGFSASSATYNQMEFPSCAVTGVKFTAENPPSYAMLALDLVANDRKLTGTTNTYATLESATVADTTRVVFDVSSAFLINAQSGSALSDPSDAKAIVSAELTLTKEQAAAREARGSGASGNGQPIPSGSPPFVGTLTVNFKSYDDATYFQAAAAGNEYKAKISITGPLIGGSNYKKFEYLLPRLKIVDDPQYNLGTAGVNPYSVTFQCVVASSNPSGMTDVYPHVLITNGRSTSFLA